MPRTGSRTAFTLIEVMVATAVLSLGTILICQALFRVLDAFSYCERYLAVVSWANEKVWETQNELATRGSAAELETTGSFSSHGCQFDWFLLHGGFADDSDLYKIDLIITWQDGARRARLWRSGSAIYQERTL